MHSGSDATNISAKDLTDNISLSSQNRTSFLIEDILYRENVQAEEQSKLTDPDRKSPPFDYHQSDNSTSFINNNNNNSSSNKNSNKIYNESASCNSSKIAFQSPNKITDKPQQRVDNKNYAYFQPNLISNAGCPTGFQSENGYIQVMGALGAYLGTPYKSMNESYFLTQGKFNKLLQLYTNLP